MTKDFAFQFVPGEYLRDTQCLSEKGQVAYDRIMCEHIRSICSDMDGVCIPKERIDFFCKRLSSEEKWEVLSVLREVGGGFQIEWVAKSVSQRAGYVESRKNNGSSPKTSKKKKKHNKAYAEHSNNNNNSIDNNNLEEENSTSSGENFNSEITQIIEHLNALADRRFHPNNTIYAQHIRARLKDGYTLQELLDIVTLKVKEWKGTEFEQYLQPDTLFNKTKCNKYRDQVRHIQGGHVQVPQLKVVGMKNANIHEQARASFANKYKNQLV